MRIFDTTLLLVALIFFWFPSSFPLEFTATGINTAEWRVLFGILVLALLVYAANLVRSQIHTPVYLTAALAGSTFVGLIVIRWMLPGPGEPLPVDRADWLWLPFLLIPGMLLRWWHTRHLWPHTILDAWFLAFVLLVIINVYFTPYESRGVKMAGRPLLGMAIVIHLMTVTYETGSLRAALRWSLGLSLTVGIMGLTMTQWNEKSAAFSSMIDIIPRIERVLVPNSLNPNEIGGALAWVVPFSGGLIAYPWGKKGRLWWVLCIISFLISLTALLWGQSRFAIGGVILALAGIAWFLLQPPWRRIALIGVGLLFVLEVAVLFNLVAARPATEEAQIEFGLTQRDSDTSMQRLQIWDAALRIIYRYPVTGVGMDRFRSNEARLEYPVTGFDIPDPAKPDAPLRPRPPHAHNEFLQLGTDFGVPGLLLVIGIYGMVAYMGHFVWNTGTFEAKIVVVSGLAGLLAHAVYGLGDAIPLWDRFAFLFWFLIGVIAACYVVVLADLKKD